MKSFTLIAFVAILLFSCNQSTNSTKNTLEEQPKQDMPLNNNNLMIVSDSIVVNWTAYKTTEKVPVGGSFTDIEIANTNKGETPKAILDGGSFKIPVNSLFTNNEERDRKLLFDFFSKMTNTEYITGGLSFKNDTCFLSISMNNISKQFPVEYTAEDKLFEIKPTTIQLADFKALEALASLNKVCYDLHKGLDGISKTWEEVEISGKVLFE